MTIRSGKVAAQLVVAIAMVVSGCASKGGTPLRGHYTWGHEVEAFRPCGSAQAFWVVGDDALLQPLRDKALAMGKPYVPLYVEASGVGEARASDGFAADYDGVYRFTAVQVADSASPAGCPPPA